MSDEVKDEFIDMEQIPKGSEIPIIITTNMYIRIQQLLFEGLPYKDLEHMMSCVKEAKIPNHEEHKDPLTYYVQTIAYLLDLIETSSKEKGITKMVNMNKKDIKLSGITPQG